MDNILIPHEKPSLPASSRRLTRREWVQRMLAGAGAGIAAPALAEARLALATAPEASTTAAADWKPTFFDDPQSQLLAALAERIVPGSTVAQVNRFLDTAIDAVALESQKKFVAALNAMEGEALRQFTKSFKDLSADQQDKVLTAASTNKPSNPSPAAATASAAPPAALSLGGYFEYLKGWISTAYYTSEVGMKELGWTGDYFFESLPGCEHAAGHS
jgi:hypothetical protein